MTNVDLPSHPVLTAATVKTVAVNGRFSSLHLLNQTASSVVYVRTDGTDPVVGADFNWPLFPIPHEGICVPTAIDVGGTSTTIKLISSGTPTVSILPCDCDD